MEGRALGKGLSALIPEKRQIEEGGLTARNVTFVRTDFVDNNSLQPRQHYDPEKLADLKMSIQEKGILQPLLVRPISNNRYEVVAGERRLRVARELRLEEVPVVVRDVKPEESLVLALVENIQREELNAIEEAHAYMRLMSDFQLSQEDIAQAVSKDRSTISNLTRLLKLPTVIQDAVSGGDISMGHARALLSADDAEHQRQLFSKILDKGLSVRETENLLAGGGQTRHIKKKKAASEKDHEYIYLEDDLRQFLGTKVSIQPHKKRGKIVIEYYSPDDLERLLNVIKH